MYFKFNWQIIQNNISFRECNYTNVRPQMQPKFEQITLQNALQSLFHPIIFLWNFVATEYFVLPFLEEKRIFRIAL